MRYLIKITFFVAVVAAIITACDKKDSLPFYDNGSASSVTLSTTTVAPPPSDSDNVALTASWTNPAYAADSSTVKYVVQIDSAGRNFSKAVSKTITGALSATFTARELNTIALGYGFAFNTAYSMDVRVVSSYANNNDQKLSNVITFQYTPYKIPPKVALPSSGELYLVGNATQGGWTNPVPAPAQQFARIDETTWAGVFQLNGASEYLVLPVNGDWSHKYAVPDNSIAGLNTGGDFGYDASANFPGPSAAGLYIITLNFQTGKFTVVPYTGGALPDNLFMVGSATPGGWNNPVPVPSQQFTRLNSSQFELIVALNGGQEYLFLPVNGDWSHKFALNVNANNTEGTFQYDTGSNFPGPTDSGTYKVYVDFITNTYTLTKQ